MKFNYDNETDSLYISFNDKPGLDSYEIAPEYIVDIDSDGKLIGIEVLNVKDKIDLKTFIFNQIDSENVKFLNQEIA